MGAPPVPARWYHKLGGVLYSLFCIEVGVFLVLFPWLGHWEINYFAWLMPETPDALEFAQKWRQAWMSPFFRGAVSGLGVVDIYIGIREAFGLKRFAMLDPVVELEHDPSRE